MKDQSDEDMLFRRAGSSAADKLRKEARKLKRAEDRKQFWKGRKGDKRND